MVNAVYRKMKSGLARLAGRGAQRFDSAQYWDERYRNNGTSGAGSYKHLATFKADVLNALVAEYGIESVVEFGCGDGNQLGLARYPRYTGFDVSPTSIGMCRKAFANDPTKTFHLASKGVRAEADLALSLDVIYHLVEDDVYHRYMEQLFRSSSRWVIVYSSNQEGSEAEQSLHVRHRKFTDWVDRHAPDFKLVRHVRNKYPLERYGADGSFADFFVFQKQN